MKFLESVVFVDEVLRPVGNMGWYQKGGTPAQYDQQGIDAMAMVLYYQKAYQIRRNRTHLDKMWRSYQWFLGANDLGLPLFDAETAGCSDGLQPHGTNLNQGAESTLAYWISHLAVVDVLQK